MDEFLKRNSLIGWYIAAVSSAALVLQIIDTLNG